MINRYILGLFAILSSCAHQNAGPPPGPLTFTIGNPYQAGGEWRYPRNYNNYDATGLSTIISGNTPAYTADNEAYDPDALAAFSPVLQLPCIVTVTNLVNGHSVDVRVNGRGPDIPGRILAVTPRVARLLNYPSGGVVEVEVKLNTQQTAILDSTLGDGPKMTAAPEAGITAQSLGPPGSATAGTTQNLTPLAAGDTSASIAPLTGAITVSPPSPGPLFVQIPGFGRPWDARDDMQRLSGMPTRIVPQFGGDRTLYAINIGPYHSVKTADAALQQVLSLGIPDPEVIVR